VGINGTRAMTAFNSRDGGFFLTTVGRVQTPTLSLVVEREEKIRKFISRDYWEIHATFGAQAGEYPAKWFDPKWKKSEDVEARADRVWSAAEAQSIANAVRGKQATVTEEASPPRRRQPLLFDLTSLQREANGKFGFLGQDHAGAGAKPVRAPQGPDLPAYRLARAARGLPARGQADLRDAGRQRHAASRAARAHGTQQQLRAARPSASLTTARSAITLPSSPRCRRRAACRSRAEAVRPGRAPLHGGVLPER
jgi:Topoisomerase IA